MMLQKRILLSIFTLMITFSCTCKREQTQAKKEKEVKKSDIKVEFVRFEKELFASNPNNIDAELQKLQAKYPTFYNVFYNQVLSVPAVGAKDIQLKMMQDFITNKYNIGLYDSGQQQYTNLDFLKEELQEAFANYKSYFPEKPTPKVVTCISDFTITAFTITDSIIGISLDMYLGEKYIYYADVFKEYTFMIPTFEKKYIAIDCANVLAKNLVAVPDDKSTLLDKMLAEGKILYFIQSVLPSKKDAEIIKYTNKQYQWCLDNELQIWTYFLNQNRLYDTKFEQFKYVKDGPSTYGMPKESPGKAGAWLGWQIIRKYMQEKPNTTLKQLIDMKDGQKILTDSKYKPKA